MERFAETVARRIWAARIAIAVATRAKSGSRLASRASARRRWIGVLGLLAVLVVAPSCGDDRADGDGATDAVGEASDQIVAGSYSASSTASATTNYTSFSIFAYEGSEIVVGTCGVAGSSVVGNSYLRLRSPAGVEVASNDDACGGQGSLLTYPVRATGTYTLRAGCFLAGACSGTVAYVTGRHASMVLGGYSASGSGFVDLSIPQSLPQGTVLQVGTTNLDGTSFSGDTHLELRTSANAVIASNDNFGGPGSYIQATIPSSGSYKIRASCSGGSSCRGLVRIQVPERDLAWYYAPVVRHNTDCAWSYPLPGFCTNENGRLQDYLSRVDYDGDWDASNNWDNLYSTFNWDSNRPRGYIYFGVVSTATHHYINYNFYHPRDWNSREVNDGTHENDLEPLLVVVRRDGAPFGRIEAAITDAHNNFYSYIPPGGLLTGNTAAESTLDIDGTLVMNTTNGRHPEIYVESGGHGPYHFDPSSGVENESDIIVYHPYRPTFGAEGVPPMPPKASTSGQVTAYYDLISDDTLWARRFDYAHGACAGDGTPDGHGTFKSWGTFNDGSGSGGAKAFWFQDDTNDGPTYRGELAFDPAKVHDHYFLYPTVDQPVRSYLKNKYAVEVRLQQIMSKANLDPGENPAGNSDVYWAVDVGIRETSGSVSWRRAVDRTSIGRTTFGWYKVDYPLGAWVTTENFMPRSRFYAIRSDCSAEACSLCPSGPGPWQVRLYDADWPSGEECIYSSGSTCYFEAPWNTSGTDWNTTERSELQIILQNDGDYRN
jgi:hypothetical protein